VLQVGTQTIVSPVLPRATLHVGQEWRTHFPYKRLGCVDEGKSLLDVFITQAVPAGDRKHEHIYNRNKMA
jgi:hypothetical protein